MLFENAHDFAGGRIGVRRLDHRRDETADLARLNRSVTRFASAIAASHLA